MTELTRLKRFGEKQTFMTRFIITSYVRLMKFKPKDYLPQLNWFISILARTETRSRNVSKITEEGIYSDDGRFIPYTDIILARVHEEYTLTDYPETITISSKCYLDRAKKGYAYVRSMFIGKFQYDVSDIGPENYCDPFLSYYHLSTLLCYLNKNDIPYQLSQSKGILTVIVHNPDNKMSDIIIAPHKTNSKLMIFSKEYNELYTGTQAIKLLESILYSN